MLWFGRGTSQTEIWERTIQWPLDDLEAARTIRQICDTASIRLEDKRNKHRTEQYERAAKTAMEIVIKMADDLLRDAAVRKIVGLCMKANDLRTAKILFRAIQNDSIHREMLNEQPTLHQ
jgi:hypothetical protein